MWTFIAGYLTSYIFEYLIIKLHKEKFSNKNISIFGIIIGWFFQEHVRNDFNVTAGKKFMINKDFRNYFLTNILKVTRNFIFWSHIITFFELGTFILLLLFFFIFLPINLTKSKVTKLEYFTNLYSRENLDKLLNYKIKKIEFNLTSFGVFVALFFIIKEGFKLYSLYDLFFISRPLIILCIYTYLIFSIIWLIYLIYIFINSNFKQIGLIFKLFYLKINYYIFCVLIVINAAVNLINFEYLNTENFYQELLLKLSFFLWYTF